eukprot:409683-Pelagomonas_calceolata.AAC.5
MCLLAADRTGEADKQHLEAQIDFSHRKSGCGKMPRTQSAGKLHWRPSTRIPHASCPMRRVTSCLMRRVTEIKRERHFDIKGLKASQKALPLQRNPARFHLQKTAVCRGFLLTAQLPGNIFNINKLLIMKHLASVIGES